MIKMTDYPSKDNLLFTYSICAVIFGTDDSVQNIKLLDGFSFKKLSLIPHVDHLDSVFDTNAIGLRRDYEPARLNKQTLDVICIVKQKKYTRSVNGCVEKFYDDSDKDLISIDNQIRVIRLIKECPIRFKRIAFHLNSEKYIIADDVQSAVDINDIFPVSEAIKTVPISKFSCTKEEAEIINQKLKEISFPLKEELQNICHRYYDLSYHTEKFISITLLITSLEILFLKKGEKAKSSILSKRCSVFISDDYSMITANYIRLKTMYDKRSLFIHEGKSYCIIDEDIIFLRECVRKSLLKAMSLAEDKRQRIKKIKGFVEQHNELFGE